MPLFPFTTEELYLGNPKFTLGKFCIQFLLLQQLQYYLQMLFVLLLVLGIDQNIVNKDNYEFVQIRQSSRCILLEPSIGDNLTLGRSLSRHSTLEVDRISHQFSVADNGSSPSYYKAFIGKALYSGSANSFISEWGQIDKVPGATVWLAQVLDRCEIPLSGMWKIPGSFGEILQENFLHIGTSSAVAFL
ncbi:hypothetical protein Tco_0800282 [Tanacetum coccineum]|uniref:Uncharacterized protein n=1 Tax=Tanacetum coccineum TaxID=301880 RepID=A0ABQ4ZSN8_9ASTR